MKFTDEQLQRMIAGEPIGDTYPYNTKDKKEIENYIQNLFYTLNRSAAIKCEAQFDHYGSGYASYVDFFCYKKDGSSVLEEKYIEKDSLTSIHIEGLVVYVSRLTPVAIIGKDNRYKSIIDTDKIKDEFFSGMSFLGANSVITEPPDFMSDEFREIKRKLVEAGYRILEKEYLSQPLPFETKIPTILTIPKLNETYKVFDAIFYWMD